MTVTIAQFNHLESVLWFALATAPLMAEILSKQRYYRRNRLGASATFLLFAISDLIEARTRAWWRPVDLLVLKGLCVASLLGHFLWYQNLRRQAVSSD